MKAITKLITGIIILLGVYQLFQMISNIFILGFITLMTVYVIGSLLFWRGDKDGN